MNGGLREQNEIPPRRPQPPGAQALGLEAIHALCRDMYPDQTNPLTVTAVLKYW